MCETQKVERFRTAVAALGAALGRDAELVQTRGCFAMGLEPDHKVIRVTHNYYIAAAAVFPPPLDPQVKYIMQVHIGE